MLAIQVIPADSAFSLLKIFCTKKPAAVLERAMKGMLPKSRLGSELFRNLYVVVGDKHDHQAQQPKKLDLNKIK